MLSFAGSELTVGSITFSSLLSVAPDPLPESLGCISKMVLNRFSESVVRNPISAFKCRPYKLGLSEGKKSSI